MKKFLICSFLLIGMFVSAAVKAPAFAAAKKASPVLQAAFAKNGSTLCLCLRLKPETPADFSLSNIYLYTDEDRNTGRKGVGNEYYFDIPKSQISSYTKEGKGTLNRNALTIVRSGDWFIIAFDESVTLQNPLKEFEIVFATNSNARDRIVLRGTATEEIELPELPEEFGDVSGEGLPF